MIAEERVALSKRTAAWCYDNTESWSKNEIGAGLAYLQWAIVADDGVPFDARAETTGGKYDEFVELLRENPNGLLDTLVAEGFILL